MAISRKRIIKYITSFIFLAICYFALSATFALAMGIRLPQPFPGRGPIHTFLADPLADKVYTKSVKAGDIQKLLDAHKYGQKYQPGVFDCSDMSRETAKFLQADGYHTSVIGDDNSGHAWAFVWTSKNSGWAIETATDVSLARGSAGEVMGNNWWDAFYVHAHDKKTNLITALFSSHAYDYYYPPIDHGGLHVLEWNDPSLNGH